MKPRFFLLFLILGWLVACRREPEPTPTPPPEAPVVINAETVAPVAAAPLSLPAFNELVVEDLAFQGNYGYVVARDVGLLIYDWRDPDQPLPLSRYQSAGAIRGITLVGRHAFLLACDRLCIEIVDIAQPRNLTWVGTYATFRPGPIAAMAVADGKLAVGWHDGTIQVADVARPYDPQKVGETTLPGLLADLALKDGRLYAAARHQGVYRFDLSSGFAQTGFWEATRPVWHEDTPGDVLDLAMEGDATGTLMHWGYAYVAAAEQGFRLIQLPDYGLEAQNFYHLPGVTDGVAWHAPNILYVTSYDPTTRERLLTTLYHDIIHPKEFYGGLFLLEQISLGEMRTAKLILYESGVYVLDELGRVTYHPLTHTEPVPEVAASEPVSPTQKLELVNHIGGVARSVAVQGQYAYLGVDHELQIYDISDTTRPVLVGRHIFAGFVNQVVLFGDYAYVRVEFFEAGYLSIVDVSDPTHPFEASGFSGFVQDIQIVGQMAYITEGYYIFGTSLLIADLTDPVNPTVVGHYSGGGMWEIEVVEQTVYLTWLDALGCLDADCPWSIRIIDVSDPTQPRLQSIYHFPVEIRGLAVTDGFVYTTDKDGKLIVLDVSDPDQPRRVVTATAKLSASNLRVVNLVVHEGVLYGTDQNGQIRAFSVTDPLNITEYPAHPVDSSVRELVVADGLLFAAATQSGLHIFPLAPAATPLYSPQPIVASDVVIHDQYAYVADKEHGLHVFDVSQTPEWRKTVSVVGSQPSETLHLAGELLYAVTISHTIDVFDIQNPAQPLYIMTFPHLAQRVFVADGRAYFTNDDQLTIWDVTQITNPLFLGVYQFPTFISSSPLVDGDYLYLTIGGNMLLVLEVSEPASPRIITSIAEIQGIIPFSFEPGEMMLDDSTLYVFTEWAAGILVFDRTNPTSPVYQTSWDSFRGYFGSLIFQDNYAYAVRGGIGDPGYIIGFDITNPLQPTPVQTWDYSLTDRSYTRLVEYNGYLIAAAGQSGILIFQPQPIVP